VAAEKACYPVRTICRALDLSPSGFYAWRHRPRAARAQTDRRLRVQIRAVHAESRGRYGSPRVHEALQQQAIRVGRNRVIRLMRAEGLHGRPTRRFRVTTRADPHAAPAPNHLQRQFQPARLNAVWAGDITAIPIHSGWLYLAVVLDLRSRRVLGWAVDRAGDTALVLQAWAHALALRGRPPQMYHSDRGCQYTSTAFQSALAQHGVRCSMSRKGNCFDNAVVESFFRTLKVEGLPETPWADRHEAMSALSAFIDDFYNRRRLHSTLGYRSPIQFEQRQAAVA